MHCQLFLTRLARMSEKKEKSQKKYRDNKEKRSDVSLKLTCHGIANRWNNGEDLGEEESVIFDALDVVPKNDRKKHRDPKGKRSSWNHGIGTHHGIVKCWKTNGYGFITWNGEDEWKPQDIFFHMYNVKNNVSDKGSRLSNSPGRKCTFNLGLNPKSRKIEAKNVFIY